MPKFTLEHFQEAADKKYGPTVITLPDGDVTLDNPIRMSKERRKKLTDSDKIEDVEEKLQAVVKVACEPAEAKRLLAAIGEDLAVLADIVTEYMQSAQVGEASPSPS
jgi:hypothetical protein